MIHVDVEIPVTDEMIRINTEEHPGGCPTRFDGFPSWSCTRREGHDGPHLAGTGSTVVAAWMTDPDLALDRGL